MERVWAVGVSGAGVREGVQVAEIGRELQFHPASMIFPMMDPERFAELVEDIRANGLRLPIILQDGMILDGRNRYKACVEIGIDLVVEHYEGNPWALVWSLNGGRRDLVADQRALIYLVAQEKLAKWESDRIQTEANRKRSEAKREDIKAQPRTEGGKFGSKPSVPTNCGQTRACDDFIPCEYCGEEYSAAKMTSGLCEMCQETQRIRGEDLPRKYSYSQRMREALAKEKRYAKSPGATTLAALSGTNRGAIERAGKLLKHAPNLAKKVMAGELKPSEAHRQLRKTESQAKAAALPDGTYRVIYADPPWQYNDARQTGDHRESTAATYHYGTMSLMELKALKVNGLAAPDSVLFLWATFPLLPDALEIIKSWGFIYKTAYVWDKGSGAFGHYHNASAELLLLATRGSCVPDADHREDQVQQYERLGHSRKPHEWRKLIERIYKYGPRIELFHRGDAPSGWTVWGSESND